MIQFAQLMGTASSYKHVLFLKQFDGSGGNGSALRHYDATDRKYPLAVKLGTITPHGADVYSYAPDEDSMVIDPELRSHLLHWGIDMMQMDKTEKTMSELQVFSNHRLGVGQSHLQLNFL